MIPDAPTGSALERVYEALDAAGSEFQSGQDWTCPNHGDTTASLGVTQGDKGVLIKCQGSCTTKEVLSAIGLKLSDLFDKESKPNRDGKRRGGDDNARVVKRTTYTYKNAQGKTVRLVTRADLDNGKKRITQKVIDKAPVLYRLPGLRKAIAAGATPVILEGEKSVIAYSEVCGKEHYPTTAPMGAKWLEAYTKQLKGAEKVIIVADNDDTGFRYAQHASESLGKAGIAVEVFVTATFNNHDDIVDHLAAGYEREQLVCLDAKALRCILAEPGEFSGELAKSGEVRSRELWPTPGRSYECAAEYVRRCVTIEVDGKRYRNLHYWQDQFYMWDGQKYLRKDTEQIRAMLGEVFDHAKCVGEGEGAIPVDWKPNTSRLNDVLNMLKDCCYLSRDIDPGSILDENGYCIREAGEQISFPNGMLDLEKMELIEPTPAFFNHTTVSYRYDSSAPSPTRWLDFLNSTFTDQTAIAAIQEWFGYVLAGDTRLQKAFMLVGPARSGKGTILRTLETLLGPNNVANPDIFALGSRFGLQACIGKLAANIGDARFTYQNAQEIVTRLLTITGEDGVTVDRKGITPWTGRFSARFSIASNELPSYRDSSGAFINRFILVTIPGNGHVGTENTFLLDEIQEGMPGILLWALQGLRRVRMRREFTRVLSSRNAFDDMRELSAPVTRFWSEELIKTENKQQMSTKEAVFQAWLWWCKANNFQAGNSINFGKEVTGAMPEFRTSQRVVKQKGKSESVWFGWRLRNSSYDT